jgi:hypothetical protein
MLRHAGQAAELLWRDVMSSKYHYAAPLMALFAIAACSSDPFSSPDAAVRLSRGIAGGATLGGVRISASSSGALLVGQSVNLGVRVQVDSRTRRVPSISWSSSNPSVVALTATSSSAATATGIAPGSAYVRVSDGVNLDSTLVTVANMAVTVAPASGSLLVGQTLQLTGSGPTGLVWTTGNVSVAQVSSSGTVTAIGPGSTLVTATSPSGSSASASITVTAVATNPGTPNATLPASLDGMVISARSAVASRTISPATGGALQAALDTARYGDEILLNPSVTYVGNFVFSKRAGTGWITVRSSSSSLPAAGIRIRPSNAALLGKLQSAHHAIPVFRVDTGAQGLRVIGVEMRAAPTATMAYALVEIGSATHQWTSASAPRNIVLERVWIHGSSTLDFQRCLALQSGATAVLDSWLSDCHGRGYDSQAIVGWNGPGPYQIVNNYLEGAGENLMFGGADPAVPNLVPSDIEVRGNHFYKPPSWQGAWTVKNLLEFKAGIRVLIENNVFENNWADAQSGAAILFRSVNQSGGAPWSETRDLIFRYNIVRNSANGMNIIGIGTSHPAIPMSRVYIAHNSWELIGNGAFNGGALWQIGGVVDLVMENNTGFGKTHGVQFLSGRSGNLVLRNNVFGKSEENIGFDFALGSSEGFGWGTAALNAHAQTWTFVNNVVTKGASQFPAGNSYVSSPAAIGLSHLWSDTALNGSSSFLSAGTAGSMPGADYIALRSRLQGVVVQP